MSWAVKPMMTERMLVATRRKVVRKSARDWPEKSYGGRTRLVGGGGLGLLFGEKLTISPS
jgi:hypothetical protein